MSPGQGIVIPFLEFEKGGLTLRQYQTVPIVAYHRLSKSKSDIMTVTEKAFEEQMKFLKEHGYRVISMNEFFDFIDFKREIPRKSVVITFDDGWRSFHEIAFPILKKYGYPATLFIYTDFVAQGSNTLDWKMLREVAQHGIDVQCHSRSHRYLDRQIGKENFQEYFEAVRKELVDSAKIIRERTGSDVKYLAYPYGDTSPLLIALLVKLGYRGAFTVDRGSNPFFIHPYQINRSMIYGTFSLKDFERNLVSFGSEALK